MSLRNSSPLISVVRLAILAALLLIAGACGQPQPVADPTREASLSPSNPWNDAIADAEKSVTAAEVAVNKEKAADPKTAEPTTPIVVVIAEPVVTDPVVPVVPVVTPPVVTVPVVTVPVVTPDLADKGDSDPIADENIVARVTPKGFKVSDGVPFAVATSLEKTVEAGTGDIVECYRAAVRQGAAPEGKLTIKIDLDEAGATTAVTLVTDEPGPPTSTCVVEKAGAWVYEAPGMPVSIYRRWLFGD